MADNKKTKENQRRVPKQARAREKYDAVLDACTQVLARYGYKKTSILELSLTSEVAVPTIYQYFPNKEAIFSSWFNRTVDQVLEETARIAAEEDALDLESFIHQVISGSLFTIDISRASMRNLHQDLPQLLVKNLLSDIEEKTAQAVLPIAAAQLGREIDDELRTRLRILIRCLVGYIIHHVLAESEHIDHDTAADELTQLAMAYLGSDVTSTRKQ